MLIDISHSLHPDMPVWPGDPPFQREERLTFEKDGLRLSTLHIGAHCGTHLDAPAHFLKEGTTVESLSLETLIGPAYVADLRGTARIGADNLRKAVPDSVERLLLKTDNAARWGPQFNRSYVALDESAADWALDASVRLIGMDYLSVEIFGASEPVVHRKLLGASVILVEGLKLDVVEPGWYELICLPIKLSGAEGAPCRAALRSL